LFPLVILGIGKMAYRNENGFNRPATNTAATAGSGGEADRAVLDKRAIQELVKQVDPMMQIDEEVEDVTNRIGEARLNCALL
jgi:hypothetical protein